LSSEKQIGIFYHVHSVHHVYCENYQKSQTHPSHPCTASVLAGGAQMTSIALQLHISLCSELSMVKYFALL